MLIDGEEMRAGKGIISKSGERWKGVCTKNQKEVISQEGERSGQMKSVHKRLKVPMEVG